MTGLQRPFLMVTPSLMRASVGILEQQQQPVSQPPLSSFAFPCEKRLRRRASYCDPWQTSQVQPPNAFPATPKESLSLSCGLAESIRYFIQHHVGLVLELTSLESRVGCLDLIFFYYFYFFLNLFMHDKTHTFTFL